LAPALIYVNARGFFFVSAWFDAGSKIIAAHERHLAKKLKLEGAKAGSGWPIHLWAVVFYKEVMTVDMQTSDKSGLTNNLWVQVAALVIVCAVIIALAAKYIW
jgi:hypothetical protein